MQDSILEAACKSNAPSLRQLGVTHVNTCAATCFFRLGFCCFQRSFAVLLVGGVYPHLLRHAFFFKTNEVGDGPSCTM